MEYISMDEVKTIIEFCPLIKCYGDPGIEEPFGKCHAFRDSSKELIDVCKMCKACSTYEDDIDDDCLEDRDRDIHGFPLNKKGTYYSWAKGDSTSDLSQTEVRLVPMCSCGYVFTEGLYLVENTENLSDSKMIPVMHCNYAFKPNMCPNCGRIIESMKWFDIKDKYLSNNYPSVFKRIKHF